MIYHIFVGIRALLYTHEFWKGATPGSGKAFTYGYIGLWFNPSRFASHDGIRVKVRKCDMVLLARIDFFSNYCNVYIYTISGIYILEASLQEKYQWTE